MTTFSLCMIVKNEEDVLGRCLDSVESHFDEIIIVDTGSDDKTKEIASQYTDKVFDFPWIDNFAAARNFSFAKATMQYCMWLDADDILLPEDRAGLLALKQNMPADVDVVMMKYVTAFDQQGNPSFAFFRERILRNCPLALWKGAVHEAIEGFGKIIYSELKVVHKKLRPSDPRRNLQIFEKQIAAGEKLNPRETFYYGRELYYHGRYEEGAALLQAYADNGLGWRENLIEGCRFLAYCYYPLNKPHLALRALLQSFCFDLPRAEVCCEIGKHFLNRQNYDRAIFWYEQALACRRQDQSGAFVSPDAYGYLPHIQLCLCYARMGNNEKARFHNEKAGEFKPQDPSYLHNKAYFAGLGIITPQ